MSDEPWDNSPPRPISGSTSPWRPIVEAPISGKSRFDTVKVDILAKTWVIKQDKFTFRRFTDCHYNRDFGDDGPHWIGVEEGWLPVAFMMIPEIPTSYP